MQTRGRSSGFTYPMCFDLRVQRARPMRASHSHTMASLGCLASEDGVGRSARVDTQVFPGVEQRSDVLPWFQRLKNNRIIRWRCVRTPRPGWRTWGTDGDSVPLEHRATTNPAFVKSDTMNHLVCSMRVVPAERGIVALI